MKNKKLNRIMSSTITSTMLLTSLPIGASASANSFADDFESSLNDDFWFEEVPNKTSIQTSTNYSQSGTHSLRVELNKTDANVNGSKRAEIRIGQDSPISEGPLEEHTYTFYTMLPNGGEEDYKLDPNGSEIIAQWHNQPDENEEWTSPPLSLHTNNGNYVIGRCWDDAPITSNTQMEKKGNNATYNLGSYINDKGKWVKWEFHIKWGWLSSQKPILEVYKNGVQVLNCNGLPNTTNDKVGVVMKLGLYKWNWAQVNDESIIKKRVIYFDNVSISSGKASGVISANTSGATSVNTSGVSSAKTSVNTSSVASSNVLGVASANVSGVVVNKNELQGLYDENKNKTKGNYTDASWNGFTTALNNANSILVKTNTTQGEVDTTKTNLQSAINGLVVRPSSSSTSSISNSSHNDDDSEESSSEPIEIKIAANNKVEESTTYKINMDESSTSSILGEVENISKNITQSNKDDENVQVGDIYRVISDNFKGYVANLNSEGKNYIYVSCESVANNLNNIEINGTSLNDGQKYVYNVDNVSNNLILASGVELNNNYDLIEIQPQKGKRYIIADNKMEALNNNEWNKINNEWVYVKDGQAVTGWYKSLANQWYYMNSKGIMQSGWVNDNGTWYYLSSHGDMETGWINDNGKWYHLSDNGSMDRGWIKDNTKWYHLSSSGAMDTGWIKDTNGKWYYLNANGSMVNNARINGYKLDKNGAWTK